MIKNRLFSYSIYNLDGVTLQELLCEVCDLISQCVDDVNKYTQMVDELIEWVKTEGLLQEVQEILDVWVTDGTMADIVNEQVFNQLNDRITELVNEMNIFKEQVNTDFSELSTDLNNQMNTIKSDIDTTKTDLTNQVNGAITDMNNQFDTLEGKLNDKVDYVDALTQRRVEDIPNIYPLQIAHRGMCKVDGENTVSAYQRAFVEGMDGIEIDIQTTSDNVWVCIHDNDLSRTTNGTGNCSDRDWNYIAGLVAGKEIGRNYAYKIPRFEDQFLYRIPPQKLIIVEVKGWGGKDSNIEKLFEIIHNTGIKNRIILQSFDHSLYDKVRALDSTIRYNFLVSDRTNFDTCYGKALKDPFANLSISMELLTGEWDIYYKMVQNMGKQWAVWTFNNTAEYYNLFSYNIPIFITNVKLW